MLQTSEVGNVLVASEVGKFNLVLVASEVGNLRLASERERDSERERGRERGFGGSAIDRLLY